MLKLEMVKNLLCNERGQGMVEYGLILVFIALVVIVAMTTMGTTLQGLFTDVAGSAK